MKKKIAIAVALVVAALVLMIPKSQGITTTDKFIDNFNQLTAKEMRGVGATVDQEPFAVDEENIFVALQKNSSGKVQEVLVILRPNQTGFDDVKAQEAVKIFKQAARAVFPALTDSEVEKIRLT